MPRSNQPKVNAVDTSKTQRTPAIMARQSRLKFGLSTGSSEDLETKISDIFKVETKHLYRLNLFQQPVSAGFPSPADDFLEGPLELNSYLIKHPAATFFVRADGNSMLGAGIRSGDLLIVDRSLEAKPGQIVIAALNGELTVKRLWLENNRLYLKAENSSYQPIEVTEPQELCIWGVVTSVIHLF
jgi:DNA polymerase V